MRAARNLERLGTKIPRPAIKETVSACLLCLTGNGYGRSEAAIDILYSIVNRLDENAWVYYLDECFPFDEELLYNISNRGIPAQNWCDVVSKLKLNELKLKNGKTQEMLQNSVNQDTNNVGAYATELLKKLSKH